MLQYIQMHITDFPNFCKAAIQRFCAIFITIQNYIVLNCMLLPDYFSLGTHLLFCPSLRICVEFKCEWSNLLIGETWKENPYVR